MTSDAAFRAKFADIKSADEAMALAKAEGYDLSQLSDDDLDQVAGGYIGENYNPYEYIVPKTPSDIVGGFVQDVIMNLIKGKPLFPTK